MRTDVAPPRCTTRGSTSLVGLGGRLVARKKQHSNHVCPTSLRAKKRFNVVLPGARGSTIVLRSNRTNSRSSLTPGQYGSGSYDYIINGGQRRFCGTACTFTGLHFPRVSLFLVGIDSQSGVQYAGSISDTVPLALYVVNLICESVICSVTRAGFSPLPPNPSP